MTEVGMRLNARLDDDQERRLRELCDATGQTLSEVVRTAILRYHAQVVGGVRPAEALRAAGFIGCGEAAPSLSETYKDVLGSDLERKHGHR